LGAGKTTYLNHLILNNSNIRYAIIENEYGEQSIDSELILRAEDDIIELNNGCLCCTLNDNIYDILNTLYEKRDEYDEIIIEATGVADPRGLAEPFIGNPSVKKQFPLNQIICLVDAELIESQLENTEEAIHQVTFSDILLVNKTDLVNEKELSHLILKLKRLNPLALIIFGNKERYPILKIQKRESELESILNQSLKRIDENFAVEKPNSHHKHNHTDQFNSLTFIFHHPFDYQKLHLRLLSYLTFQAIDMYRMKGLIWVNGSEDQHIIQSVGVRLAIDQKRNWQRGEKKESKIIMIGKNLQREGLEKMFSQCLIKEKK
ncbi:MAG: GTP-binding protein, partial [Saprospiraceae bacterium]|nr:GTP-binding protein [Saprospiraceae bacterium]